MLTFQDSYIKAQRLSRDNSPGTLAQLQQDMNTGYHLFNAKMTRYFTRKQQFTNIIAQQNIYQVPVDSIRIAGMTALVSNTYQPPLKEVRSEQEWRQMNSYSYQSNWPTHYFTIGSSEFAVWPIPSASVTNGLRVWYQLQDHDLTQPDVTSTTTSTTVSVTNGSPTVTATGAAFNNSMIGWQFQITATTGISDNTWYEIVAVPTTNTLTLESAYVSPTASGLTWRAGQSWVFPQEYHDAPVHYALSLYFSSKVNENRSNYHMNLYNAALTDAIQNYSSANESAVISGDETSINFWSVQPVPSPT
jgi:hypothetical protein